MTRLIVNPDTQDAWEIPLKPGINRLGRSDDNDFSIPHPSVSSSHCQIIVGDSSASLKDLGSINGTFIGETLVEESPLQSGQMIRLGDVILKFESDAPSSPFAAATPSAVSNGPAFCRFHPKIPARFHCSQCGKVFCESCVSTRTTSSGGKHMCRTCAVEVTPLEIQDDPDSDQKSFFAMLPNAFTYPFKGDGLLLLIMGTILYFMIEVAKFFVSVLGWAGWIALIVLTVIGGGYLIEYLRRVLTSTAMGEHKMPDWPEVTDMGDFIEPFLQLLGVIVISFCPVILLAIWDLQHGESWAAMAMMPALLFGCLYFPMAFLALAMMDTVLAANPLLVVPSILKVPKEYLIAVVLFGIILTVRWGTDALLGPLSFKRLTTPSMGVLFGIFAGRAVANFIGIYFLAVTMRILGMLYLTQKEKLGWHRH